MKKLKLNLDYLSNTKCATNETATPTDGIAFVRNVPLSFNGHSLDVDVCLKTGNNLGMVNMNVITPSPSDVSDYVESVVKNVDSSQTSKAAQQ